jgi:hypothetical protein
MHGTLCTVHCPLYSIAVHTLYTIRMRSLLLTGRVHYCSAHYTNKIITIAIGSLTGSKEVAPPPKEEHHLANYGGTGGSWREILGRHAWFVLHSMAAKYPEYPGEADKQAMLNLIGTFGQVGGVQCGCGMGVVFGGCMDAVGAVWVGGRSVGVWVQCGCSVGGWVGAVWVQCGCGMCIASSHTLHVHTVHSRPAHSHPTHTPYTTHTHTAALPVQALPHPPPAAAAGAGVRSPRARIAH